MTLDLQVTRVRRGGRVTSGASAPSTSLSGAERRRRERELLADLADLAADDPRRAAVRDELVTMHLPLVQHLARRYRDRGESVDDLVQVGHRRA